MKKINKLKEDLSKAIDKEYAVDLSDIGNTIGWVIGHYLDKEQMGFDKDDFINGIKHGLSLADGTHGTH